MAKRNGRSSTRTIRNDDITDKELLANIKDAVETDGWATTTGIAVECGFNASGEKGDTPARKVASRLSWMRDGGLLESTDPDLTRPYKGPGDHDTRWKLSPLGEILLSGRLSKPVENAIAQMDAGAMLMMMRQLAQTGYVGGDLGVAFAMSREWRHHASQRKLSIRR